MRMIRIAAVLLLLGSVPASGEVTPDDLIQAVDQMSPEQVYEFQQKLEAKLWKPVPQGFFTRMAVDIGVSYSALDTVDLSSVTLSGGSMDVDAVGGIDLSLLWRILNERLRLGVRFGNWAAMDSNLADAGYTRAEVTGGNVSLVANYQLVRSDSWLLWAEVAPGAGAIAIEMVDTPTGEATTLRSLDGSFGQVDVLGGVSLRLNPVIACFLTAGYRFAESVDLEEGGKTTAMEVDATGFNARTGLGVNF